VQASCAHFAHCWHWTHFSRDMLLAKGSPHIRHGHSSSSLLVSSCVALRFLLLTAAVLVLGRSFALFFRPVVDVEGCGSSFELRFLCFVDSRLLMRAALFAAALEAMAEERASATFNLSSNSFLYGDPVKSVADSALRVRERTPEIFGRGDIAKISLRAAIARIHKTIYVEG